MLAIFIHSYRFQALFHPLPDLPGRHPHVFRSESHILFHYLSYDLVVRILKYHACSLTDIPDHGFVTGIHPVHPHGSFRRIQYGIDMLGKRRFSGTVMAKNREKFSRFHIQIHLIHSCGDPLHISFFIPPDIFVC
jgi:hypothetical protein